MRTFILSWAFKKKILHKIQKPFNVKIETWSYLKYWTCCITWLEEMLYLNEINPVYGYAY